MTSDKQLTKSRERKKLLSLLGDLPSKKKQISATRIYKKENKKFSIEKLLLDLNGIQKVPAYFLLPKNLSKPAPAILYSHAHGGDYKLGKDEIINGRRILSEPSYGEALTQLGCAVLCIDSWVFGERSGRTESSVFKEMLWNGRILWGMMVYDSLRALDYLASREDVDVKRIGALGMSMGSSMSQWVAALDTRVKVCVDICCLTDYETLAANGAFDLHGLYYYVPGLLKHFSAADVNRLISPRAHLAVAGADDPLTPLDGLMKIDEALKKQYEDDGADDAWRLSIYDTGHQETPEMREEILDFIDSNLLKTR